MKQFLLLIAFFSCTIGLSAQVIWTGEGDGITWDDPSNWLDGLPPFFGDDILIESGIPEYIENGVIYGSLDIRSGSNLSVVGDLMLSGSLTMDETSRISLVASSLNNFDKIVASQYFVAGDIDLIFFYVPQIGNSFKVIEGSLVTCGLSTTDFVGEGQATGFELTFGVECQSDGVRYTVTDINYTTGIAWDGEGGDNQWITAANWDPNGVPQADDIVIINSPTGAFVNTPSSGTTRASQILIGDNNTLIINGDLEMFSYAHLSSSAIIEWNKGTLSKSDPNVQSGISNYGEIRLNDAGPNAIDANFTISNSNIINHNGGNLYINNGSITNFSRSSYNINGDNITIGYLSGTNHQLRNTISSTIRKTASIGTSTISLDNFINEGRIEVQQGTLAIGESFDASNGTVSGSGATSFPPDYVYDGELSPGNSPGTLTFAGNLTTASTATFNIEIDGPLAGTEYDQIIVADNAILEGTLNIALGYLPANDASFEILVANTLQSCNFPNQLTTSFNGTDYTFDVVCANNKLLLNGPGFTLSNAFIESDGIGFSPNPVTNTLTISAKTSINGSFILYNSLGQIAKSGDLSNQQSSIDTSNIKPGLYMLQIKDKDKQTLTVNKIIKK